MEFDGILYTKDQGVATITFNRPKEMNAITYKMEQQWAAVMAKAKRDPEVRVIVITGAGRTFCGGANPRVLDAMEGRDDLPAGGGFPIYDISRLVIKTLVDLDKPYIGAINGAAVGGGMDMASACDIRIASEKARFSMAYVRMGVTPALGGAYFLPRIVGTAKACELIWTGRNLDAHEALAIGYVSKVVPPDELMPATLELAQELARGPALAIRMSKQLVYRCQHLELDAALEAHAMTMLLSQGTEDAKEGPRAWVEKREPQFKGR